MNHTFSEVPLEVQGVIIFGNWLLCMTTVGLVAYYALIARALPNWKLWVATCKKLCCDEKKGKRKKKKKKGKSKQLIDYSSSSSSDDEDEDEDDDQRSDETLEEYRERVERQIDKGRVQVRADMKIQQDFKADLGME